MVFDPSPSARQPVAAPADPMASARNLENQSADFKASAASPTPEERTEAMRPVAVSSANVYLDGILSGGVPRSAVDPHRAFVDGFMTAIELLLTAGERRG